MVVSNLVASVLLAAFFVQSRSRGSIVARIEAGVIQAPINRNPIRLIDAPPVAARGADRKGRGHLDPTSLFLRDQAKLFGDFGQVLILAKDQRHVVLVAIGQVDRVQRNADINPLLFGHQKRMSRAGWQLNRLIAIAKRTREDMDSTMSHRSQFGRPELIPKSVVLRIGDAAIEASRLELPALLVTNSLSQSERVIVGIAMSKRFFGRMKEILPIH